MLKTKPNRQTQVYIYCFKILYIISKLIADHAQILYIIFKLITDHIEINQYLSLRKEISYTLMF